MPKLTERLLAHIRREELLSAGERVGVAVSGGIDSVALLRLLLALRSELGIVLSVVHFNHGLRGAESQADEDFVAGLARAHDLEFFCASGDVEKIAAEAHSGIEATARELRYGFFRELLAGVVAPISSGCQGLKLDSSSVVNGTAEVEALPILPEQNAEPPWSGLDKVVTGHTLDDQAETVLMRLIRGTGLRGLGGIFPRVAVEDEGGEIAGEIIRPLLGVRRCDLEQYLNDIKQPWREDSSNADSKFTRNRLRKLVMPLLEREFNPAVAEGLSELAEIARDEEDYWEGEVSGWLGTVVQWSEPQWAHDYKSAQVDFVQIEPAAGSSPICLPMDLDLRSRMAEAPWLVMNASVSRPWLLTEARAVQRRVIKAIGEEAGLPLEFKHIEEILRFAAEDGPSGKELSLPLGWRVAREAEAMVFLTPDLRTQATVADYEYTLEVPGSVVVREVRGAIEALRLDPEGQTDLEVRLAEYNPQQLLRADLLPGILTVRNWRAGDRFWPAHTKAPKKVKELLQEMHVSGPERRLWPVVVSGDEIVWMRGFPVPAKLRADKSQAAVLIREAKFDWDASEVEVEEI